jgi:DNA-binding transcriptional LysR family regulator
MVSDLLMAPPVVPVAAPRLLERLGRPANAAALLDWPKIHDADRGGWALWFASQGAEDPGSARGPSFDDLGLLRTAVLAGQGAGLLPAQYGARLSREHLRNPNVGRTLSAVRPASLQRIKIGQTSTTPVTDKVSTITSSVGALTPFEEKPYQSAN